MTDFEKWSTRYKNNGCTKENLQDLYTLKVITKDEYVQIVGEEPIDKVLQPNRFDVVDGKLMELETSNVVNSDMIFMTMDATTELNEANIQNTQMVLISMDALTEINEQLIALQEQITTLKGGVA